MSGGRTAHSMLQIPTHQLDDYSACNISKGTSKSHLLNECEIIFWDEISMMHRNAIEAVNTTLKDIRNSDESMGGILMILAGDFRQTLPIVKRGTMADEIDACIKSSNLWGNIDCFQLKTNMRLRQGNNAINFASYLMSIGNGTHENENETIVINDQFCNFAKDIDQLIQQIYENLNENIANRGWLAERAILSTKNETVDDINFKVMDRLNGESRIYYAVDKVLDDDDTVNYPTEFLNSLCPSGMPPFRLVLKKGAPIMLLRNLNPPMLCNGTRLIVKSLHNNIIEATIITGEFEGETVIIPRIPLHTNDCDISFARMQFPIKLAYAITINKSQGQSFSITGVDLRNEVFSHGQLYVGMSRARDPAKLYILIEEDHKTKNIVYKKIIK